MAESLLSVGLDVGTTTTQLVVSRLTVENRATGFAVPEMEIAQREVVYASQVYFTPLLQGELVDGQGIRDIVEREYKNAGITKAQVDTGAVIITGETSRRENARTVLDALSAFAGDFVVATAGPDLESILAAKGAGADVYSARTGKTVLHMDIGGGTSNLALIVDGKIVKTGCLNVGGRLVKFDLQGRISYVSPVVQGLTDLTVGQYPKPGQVEQLAGLLAQALEMAAGLREPTDLLERLWTKECCHSEEQSDEESPISKGILRCAQDDRKTCVISFSGGVADCIDTPRQPGQFGDMGAQLGRAIKESRLCQGEYVLGSQTIRATVIGAGCHSAQLSGSTVFVRNVSLPVKNLPAAVFEKDEQESHHLEKIIAQRLTQLDTESAVLCFPGFAGSYLQLTALAEKIARAMAGKPIFVCLEADMAKALGQKISLLLPDGAVVCIDRVRVTQQCYLDIGAPVGPALPVVVKTLALQNG